MLDSLMLFAIFVAGVVLRLVLIHALIVWDRYALNDALDSFIDDYRDTCDCVDYVDHDKYSNCAEEESMDNDRLNAINRQLIVTQVEDIQTDNAQEDAQTEDTVNTNDTVETVDTVETIVTIDTCDTDQTFVTNETVKTVETCGIFN